MARFPRIMVIDDDADVCQVMEDFLNDEGYAVKSTTDPTKAIAEIRKRSYQIVILDLVMPDQNGQDLLHEIMKIDSDIAVLIFTAYPSMDTAIDTMKAGAFDYIKKPFDMDEFRDAIRNVIERKGLLVSKERKVNLEVGRRIRETRKAQRLTIKQLAKRTNLSISLISQIERAESAASMATIYKISQALGMSLERIFEGL